MCFHWRNCASLRPVCIFSRIYVIKLLLLPCNDGYLQQENLICGPAWTTNHFGVFCWKERIRKRLTFLRTHQFPYKFASRGGFAITFLLFTTCMTTCTFLERYFDRKAYSVKKIRKRNNMLTKITLEVARGENVVVHLWPSSKLWARILQQFQMYTCTLFVAMPSQSPSLPFDSVQACLRGRECVHVGQQTNMWFYTFSSLLCPQILKFSKTQYMMVWPSSNLNVFILSSEGKRLLHEVIINRGCRWYVTEHRNAVLNE